MGFAQSQRFLPFTSCILPEALQLPVRESSAVVDPRAVTQITQAQVVRRPMAKRLIIATLPSFFLLWYPWSLTLISW